VLTGAVFVASVFASAAVVLAAFPDSYLRLASGYKTRKHLCSCDRCLVLHAHNRRAVSSAQSYAEGFIRDNPCNPAEAAVTTTLH